MIEMRIEEKPAFRVIGRKIWISGQDNEQFGAFWEESKQNGLVDALRRLNGNAPGPVTNSFVFGVSCVEKDPSVRAFDFFIAAEAPGQEEPDALEAHVVPACRWAIFRNRGDLPMSLVDAEMAAFMEWLPASAYVHAHAPELEVYPACDDRSVEFWLPIMDR